MIRHHSLLQIMILLSVEFTIFSFHVLPSIPLTLTNLIVCTEKNVYCIQVNIIYFKYNHKFVYPQMCIINSPQALNLIEYILNFSRCSILVKNIKLKQKFGSLTTLDLA